MGRQIRMGHFSCAEQVYYHAYTHSKLDVFRNFINNQSSFSNLDHWLTRATHTADETLYLCVAHGSTDFLAVEANRRQRRREFVELESIENRRFAGRIETEHDEVNRVRLQLRPVHTHRIATLIVWRVTNLSVEANYCMLTASL